MINESRKKQNAVDLEESFTAIVKLAGINPYVDVPEHVVKALGAWANTAVLVMITGPGPLKPVLEKNAARLKKIGRLAKQLPTC